MGSLRMHVHWQSHQSALSRLWPTRVSLCAAVGASNRVCDQHQKINKNWRSSRSIQTGVNTISGKHCWLTITAWATLVRQVGINYLPPRKFYLPVNRWLSGCFLVVCQISLKRRTKLYDNYCCRLVYIYAYINRCINMYIMDAFVIKQSSVNSWHGTCRKTSLYRHSWNVGPDSMTWHLIGYTDDLLRDRSH